MAEGLETEVLLKQGIAAVKAGNAEQARQLLSKVLDLDPDNETAWLWMSGVVADEDMVECLKRVLAVNPHNEYAHLGLEALLGEPSTTDEETPEVSTEATSGLEPSSPAEVAAVAEGVSRGTRRTCASYFGLGLLALVTCTVCGVAVALSGTLVTTAPLQAQPTTMPSQIATSTGTATATAAPGFTLAPAFTPSPTSTPVPTNTLVVPGARIPGFPIINEGAYDEIEGRVRDLRGLD